MCGYGDEQCYHSLRRGRVWRIGRCAGLLLALGAAAVLAAAGPGPQAKDAADYAKDGMAKYRSGDFAGAVADFTEVIRRRPDDLMAYLSRALARSRTGDLQGAISDYTQVIRIDPNLAVAYNNRGSVRIRAGDIDGAIADYDQVIKIDPNTMGIYVNRANARLSKGDVAGALEDYNSAIKTNPKDADAYCSRANLRYAQGNYTGALADWTTAIRVNPEHVGAYYRRGLAKSQRGDYDGAIADFDEAIKLSPRSAVLYNSRGVAKANKNDNYGAIVDFSRAIGIYPEYAGAYNNRGIARHKQGQYEEAAADFSQAIRIDPNDAGAYNNRANARSQTGDITGAISDFTEVLKHRPQDARAYRGRAQLLYALRRWDQALRDLRKAYEIGPGQTERDYDMLGVWLILSRTGRHSEAAAELAAHLDKRKSATTDQWYGKICELLLGKISEQQLLEAAKSQDLTREDQQLCEALFYAGSMRLIRGDQQGALELLRRCVQTGVTDFAEYAGAKAEINGLLWGMYTQPLPSDARRSLALATGVGLKVTEILPGRAAAKAGLKVGDVLVSINAMPANAARLERIYETGKIGQQLQITIRRSGRTEKLTLTLGDAE